MKYKIVERYEPDEMSKAVEELLNEGWRLHGNLLLAAYYNKDGENFAETHRTVYAQALTNEQDPN